MPILSFIEYISYEKKYSLHTIKAYEDDIKSFQAFCLENFDDAKLVTVNYAQIRSWIVLLVDTGISNRSINRKVSSLKAFYKFLLKSKQIDESPLIKHKALKVGTRVQVPFTNIEIDKVIESLSVATDFKSLRNKLIVELFYSTGMRRGELIALKVQDIDFSRQTVKVLGKRNKERFIPLLNSVHKTLQVYLFERNTFETEHEYLFITEKGNKIYGTLVYRVINSYFSEVSSKVKKSPHVIRHSFATHLLNEGADLNSVKELLGHASLASTQVYINSSLKELKKVYNQAHPRSSKNENL